MLEWDVILADLEGFSDSVLRPVIEQVQEKWYPEEVIEADDVLPRCGTAYIQNVEGLGELRIVFRFPLDMDALRQVDQEQQEEMRDLLESVIRRSRFRVVEED